MAVAERLNSILDAEDESDVVVERAPDASAGAVNGASTDAITSGLEATVASLTAKLRVYQTQFSEYASEKSVVDSELAEQLARVLEGLGGAPPGSAGDGFAVLSKVGIDHGALTLLTLYLTRATHRSFARSPRFGRSWLGTPRRRVCGPS